MKNHTSVLFLICLLTACQSTNNLSPDSRSPLSSAPENQVIPLNTNAKIDAQRSQSTRRYPQVNYISDQRYSEQNFTYEIPTDKILNTKTNTRKRYAPIVPTNPEKNNQLFNKNLQSSFNAADFDTNGVNNSGFRFIPADSSAAAGPNHVVNAVNTSIEIYQKDGTQLLSTGLQNFFAILTPLNATFDPRVVYDQRESRWVVITLERTDTASGDAANTSRTLVAVSNTSDPTGSWTMAAIDSKVNISGTDHWLDFPGIGLDEEAIYITGNMFTFGASGSFGGSRLITIDKGVVGGLYAGSSSTFSITDAYNGSIATTHMPAHGFGTMPSGVGTWLVGYSGISNGTDEFIQLIRVDDPLGSPTFTQQFINLGNIDDTSASLNNAPQSGSATEIETNDRRLQDAVWRDDNLWSVMTIDPFSGVDSGQATVYWSQIDTSSLNSPSLLDSSTLGGEDIAVGAFTFFPSIAVNSDGGVAIGFSASHSSIFAGSYFALRSPTDPASTFRSSITLSAGTDTYVRTFGGSQNRWGDYSATVVDTDESCFWIYNKYAMSQGTSINSETGRWATSYGNFCNSTPVPQADSITTTQGGTSSILISTNSSVLDNDSDADSDDTLTASLSVDVSAGTLTLNSDGTFSYTHDGSTTATDSFEYFVCDDGSPISCDTQTVDISITGISVNTAPVAVNDSLQVDEDGTVTQTTLASSSLLSNDSDPENNGLLLSTTPSSPPSNGSVTLNSNGTFSYTHNGSETTTDSFNYEVCDDGSPSLCDTATVSISINPVNDAPVAVNDNLQVDENGTVTQTTLASSSLLSNDSDPENDGLLLTTTPSIAPTNGSVTLNSNGTFSYTHNGSETTTDSFDYEVCDDGSPSLCDTATVSISINPVNDAPVAVNDNLQVDENGTVTQTTLASNSLLSNDSDPENDGLLLTTTPSSPPSNGSVTINSNGTFSYTHNGSETTTDSFDYQVCDDGSPSLCDTATVTISINPVNDAPVAVNDNLQVDENGTVTQTTLASSSLLSNDSDPENDGLLLTTTPSSSPSNGSVTLNSNGTFSYTHNGSETTTDSFDYQVCDDGSPSLCDTATVSISINPVNDAPLAVNDNLQADEDGTVTQTTLASNSLLSNDSDPENDGLLLTTTPSSPPSNGSVTLNSNGTFSYTHNGSETTTDSFDYEVCDDGSPSLCDTATVSISINPVNDAPLAVNDNLQADEDGTVTQTTLASNSLLSNDSDPENDGLLLTTAPSSAPTNGSVTLNSNGTFSYTHNGSETTTDSFDYQVCDDGTPSLCDTATVSISINPVNDAPLAVVDNLTVNNASSTNQTSSGESSLLANDSDIEGHNLSLSTSPISSPLHGNITLNSNGTFQYDHDGSPETNDSFEYEVCDDGLPILCSNGTVNIVIIGSDVLYKDGFESL